MRFRSTDEHSRKPEPVAVGRRPVLHANNNGQLTAAQRNLDGLLHAIGKHG
jgi:hypothetical protein